MIATLTRFFTDLLGVSLQSLPVILLVLLLRVLLGKRVPARWRYWLWSLVLLRLLVPLGLLPHSPVSLQSLRVLNAPTQTVQASVEQSLAKPAFSSGSPALPVSLDASDQPLTPAVFGSADAPSASFSVSSAHPAASSHLSISWSTLLALLWLAGFAAGAGYLVCAQVVFSRRVEAQRVPVDAALTAFWLQFCAWQGVKRAPELQVSRAVDSPVLLGLLHVRLVLPQSRVDRFAREEYGHIFAHELGHFCQADHWFQALQLGTAVIHWFNPLVWYGLRCAEIDRELAADEWAL